MYLGLFYSLPDWIHNPRVLKLDLIPLAGRNDAIVYPDNSL